MYSTTEGTNGTNGTNGTMFQSFKTQVGAIASDSWTYLMKTPSGGTILTRDSLPFLYSSITHYLFLMSFCSASEIAQKPNDYTYHFRASAVVYSFLVSMSYYFLAIVMHETAPNFALKIWSGSLYVKATITSAFQILCLLESDCSLSYRDQIWLLGFCGWSVLSGFSLLVADIMKKVKASRKTD